MQSISVFKCHGFNSKKIRNASSVHTEKVNGHNEKLTTTLYVNQPIQSGKYTYKKCIITMDQIMKVKARVFSKAISAIVVNRSYCVYINTTTGTLICLANKSSADNIKDFFDKEFDLVYTKKIFDLNGIIKASNNVRKVQFKKLTIQTLSGSELNGNQVNTTNIYDTMNNSGIISTVAVSYPCGNDEISFSVSSTGSIVLFSTLDDNEISDFANDLEFSL